MKKLILIALLTIFPNIAHATCDHDEAVEALALNIYHEARGENIMGMSMIAEVTMNRVNDRRFPDTVCAVVYQPWQFSWTQVIRNHVPRNSEKWNLALMIAEDVINDNVEFTGSGATHYLNPDLVPQLPRWVRVYTVVGRVGNHVFYRM